MPDSLCSPVSPAAASPAALAAAWLNDDKFADVLVELRTTSSHQQDDMTSGPSASQEEQQRSFNSGTPDHNWQSAVLLDTPRGQLEGATTRTDVAPPASTSAGDRATSAVTTPAAVAADVGAPGADSTPDLARNHFSGEATAAAPPPAAATAAQPQPTPGRSYPCHAVILSAGSAYLNSRLNGDDGLQRLDGRVCSAGGRPLLCLVLPVEEAELDAYEAVLRHCYCGHLGDEPRSVTDLTLILLATERLQAQACSTSCIAALAVADTAAFSLAAINALLGHAVGALAAVPGQQQSSAARAVLCKVSDRLLQLFGDADLVCSDRPRGVRAQAQQLCHAALLQLLRSDALRACSENSVLAMADAWVGGPVGSRCSAAAVRQVVSTLRLCHLSFTFVHDVLPRLPWAGLLPAETTALLRFHASDGERRAVLQRCQQADGGPLDWYHPAPRRASAAHGGCAAFLTGLVSAATLEGALAGGPRLLLLGRPSFVNGFMCQLGLLIRRDPPARVELGLAVYVAGVELGATTVRVRGEVAIKLASSGTWGPADPLSRHTRPRPTCGFAQACVFATNPRAADILSLSAWAPYLVNGDFRAQARIAECS